MKFIKKIVFVICLLQLFSSCFGDKKTAVGKDFNSDDFENKNFSGNKYNFKDFPEDMCSYLDTNAILKAYKENNITEVKIDNKRRFMGKNCNFGIVLNNKPSDYSLGIFSIIENIAETETNWKESWAFRGSMKKSASYVPNLGKAAIWYEKQRKLEIKMDGYTIALTVPALYDKKHPNKEYDYKTKAIHIITNSKLF